MKTQDTKIYYTKIQLKDITYNRHKYIRHEDMVQRHKLRTDKLDIVKEEYLTFDTCD